METEKSRFTDEPEPHALYDRMLATLREARSLQYESECCSEWKGQQRGACTYRLELKKPGFARCEATSEGRL
jgi:hypothetical protein